MAAIRRLTIARTDAADTRRLQDSVPDRQRLLGCLEWMLARGEEYADSNLLFS
jgi:hypothetical protein